MSSPRSAPSKAPQRTEGALTPPALVENNPQPSKEEGSLARDSRPKGRAPRGRVIVERIYEPDAERCIAALLFVADYRGGRA